MVKLKVCKSLCSVCHNSRILKLIFQSSLILESPNKLYIITKGLKWYSYDYVKPTVCRVSSRSSRSISICSIKNVFLEILQDSQEDQKKRDSGTGVFLWIFKNF